MIYLEEVLGRVFADSSTKSTIANNDILVSCKDEFFFPLHLCYQKNVRLPSFDVMLNTHTTFKDLIIKLVTKTNDGEVYMVLGFKCYHDDTRMLYEEFKEMFPTDSVVTYEDYKKYENEFLFFNYEFSLTNSNKVVVS